MSAVSAMLLRAWALIPFLIPFPLGAQTLVVPPFRDASAAEETRWVAEAFSAGLTEALSGQGLRLVRREERLDALNRLGLSPWSELSRAALLRLAEELDADWLVLGGFTLQRDRLQASARLLNLRTLKFSAPVEVAGRFAGVQELAAQLGWKLLPELKPAFAQEWKQFRRRFHWVEVSAFESYLRGLIAPDRQQQLRYWLQSAKLAGGFTPPLYYLGRAYLEAGNAPEAVVWLGQVPVEDPYGPDARFYLSLAHFRRGEAALALRVLKPLTERFPVKAVWNNLGVFASRAGAPGSDSYFESAQADESLDPDLHFNLGLHHLRWQRGEEASRAFFDCLELNPADTEARFLLARALTLAGRTEEAQSVEQQAVGGQPELAKSLEARQYDLDRLELSFSSALTQLRLREREESSEPTARGDHLRIHLERGDELFDAGEIEQAREEFVQAILLDPQSYQGHLRLARVYERQNRFQDAAAELRAALWSRDTVQARVRLARIYLELDREHDAREQVGAALALDPDDAEVRSLAGQLEVSEPSPAGPGGRNPGGRKQ